MNLIDAISSHGWAMSPRVLGELVAIAERHEAGEKIPAASVAEIVRQRNQIVLDRMSAFEGALLGQCDTLSAIEESTIAPTAVQDLAAQGKTPAYFLVEDVAVVPIQGVLAKHSSMVNGASQPVGMAYSRIGRAVAMAAEDPRAKSILLDINTPGGMVSGVQDAYSEIERAAQNKPIVAYCHDMAASAGYWLAAAANKIVLSPSAMAGSIGVYTIHEDTSGALADRKIKRTLIASGPHKGAGTPGVPLNADQLAAIQSEVSAQASQFFSYISKRRSLAGQALSNVTDGRVFIGPEAVAVGLADKVVTPREAVRFAQQMARPTTPAKGNAMFDELNDQQIASIPQSALDRIAKAHKLVPEASAVKPPAPATISELKAAFPGDASYALEAAEKSLTLVEAKAQYAEILQGRLTEASKKNTELAAKVDAQASQIRQLEATSGKLAPGVAPVTTGTGAVQPENDYAAAVKDHIKIHKCSREVAMAAVADNNRELHRAWLAAGCPAV